MNVGIVRYWTTRINDIAKKYDNPNFVLLAPFFDAFAYETLPPDVTILSTHINGSSEFICCEEDDLIMLRLGKRGVDAVLHEDGLLGMITYVCSLSSMHSLAVLRSCSSMIRNAREGRFPSGNVL